MPQTPIAMVRKCQLFSRAVHVFSAFIGHKGHTRCQLGGAVRCGPPATLTNHCDMSASPGPASIFWKLFGLASARVRKFQVCVDSLLTPSTQLSNMAPSSPNWSASASLGMPVSFTQYTSVAGNGGPSQALMTPRRISARMRATAKGMGYVTVHPLLRICPSWPVPQK